MEKIALTEQDLVRNYLSGDDKAFEVLLNQTKDRVFGYIISKVRDTDLANDIFQEVFIKVIRTLKNGSYNEEGKFLPWVMRIAHNLIVDHYRSNKKMPLYRETEDFSIFSIIFLI